MNTPAQPLADVVKSAIRDIRDYPKPGIIFKDITPVLADPALLRSVVSAMAAPFRNDRIDAVAAIEARGFMIGSILAYELGCSLIPVRKAGKLPYKTHREHYDLEYGQASIEVHQDAVTPGSRVLVHDDLLATGGTAAAAASLVRRSGGTVAGFSFLINLSFLGGDNNLAAQFGRMPEYLIKY